MRRASLIVIAAAQVHAAPRATAEPPEVVLGEDRAVSIRVTGVGATPLYAQSSAGVLVEKESSSPLTRTFRWTPPEVRYPGVALFLFWQPSPAGPEAAVLRIPLIGQTTLRMETEPAASVEVQVGGAVFGPVAADARGRVAVPIRVPPDVTKALVTATSEGRRTTRTVDLDVPDARDWLAALGPEPVPREGGWLVVVHAGQFRDARVVQVRASGASVQPAAFPASADEPLLFRVAPDQAARGVALDIRGPGGETRRLIAKVSRAPAAPGAGQVRAEGRLRVNALVGGFAAGGANMGPAFELAPAISLSRRWAAELALGARFAWLRRDVEILGPLQSSLLVLPVDAALRYRALELERFGLDLRAAAGMAPFRHSIGATFQSPFAESGIGFDGFGAVQGRYRIGRWELALELRAGFTAVRTPRLTAFPGGVAALAGTGISFP